MSFPRYPEYKDSGVEWLGEVPVHWEVWKLSHAFDQIGSGTTPKTDNREYYDGGDIPWVNTGDLIDSDLDECEKRITALAVADHSSLKTYPAGSLMIAMYGATIGKLAILNFAATVNQACCVFAGKSEIASKFMFYWFLGFRQQIISLATGGGQPNISQDILRSLRAACPTLPEQTQIATFLDRETAKIDVLVAEQQQLMALLKEKRQAVISHAVTRGLNPHAPLKPSGIEWLGDVPEHWEVTRVKYHCSINGRIGFRGYTTEDQVDEGNGALVMGATHITAVGEIDLDRPVYISWDKYYESPEIMVEKGDILVVQRGSTCGKVGFVSNEHGPMTINPSLVLLKNFKCAPKLIFHYLTSTLVQGLFEQVLGSTAIPMLSQEQIGDIAFCLPPENEQSEIVVFIDSQITQLDTLTAEAQRAIDLLQERRTALISAAVTGQIDVRGAV